MLVSLIASPMPVVSDFSVLIFCCLAACVKFYSKGGLNLLSSSEHWKCLFL